MSKSSKRKAHNKRVAAGHQKKYIALKARSRGTEDAQARLETSHVRALQYIEERRDTLAQLDACIANAVVVLKPLKALTAAAVQKFQVQPLGSGSIDLVIEERDQAVAETMKLRGQLDDQQAELKELQVKLSQLHLAQLDAQEPVPPGWLLRAEREFDRTPPVQVASFLASLAQKALNWAGDHRRLNAPKSSTKPESE